MQLSNSQLEWLRTHIPLFAEMERKTRERKESEAEYRKIIPCA